MKNLFHKTILTILLMISAASYAISAALPTTDPGWPRVIEAEGRELTIYQPQIDFWTSYKLIHVRYAISVKNGAQSEEIFGVAEVEAETAVDQDSRVVTLLAQSRELRFPDTSDPEAEVLRKTVDELYPPGSTLTVSLDRVLAYLDPEKQPQQQAVELNLDPPKIFFSSTPAILVMFIGQPQLLPVVKDQKDLMFAVNSNWPVFFDAPLSRYYLLNGDNWLSATDAVKGPWSSAGDLPKSLMSLPPDENWSAVREQLPGKRLSTALNVFISTEPAELILTQGQPTFTPITGTSLMRVANTESSLFMHSGNQQYYLLTAGRWFRAAGFDGPWAAASTDLPADFATIPDDDPAAVVKAAVPGTTEAKDALLLASIPTKTITTLDDPPPLQVRYDGPPQFKAIETTTLQYAINSPNAVFLVSGRYYCCADSVWFESPTPSGPWTLCSTVPAVIYTIPPSHPAHNVTYVVVQDATPTTVIYTQTAGYSGEYVATTGVLMFGAGMAVGAILADDDHYYYPRYPVPYSYGWGARYDYHYGGYYRGGSVTYGPYAGGGSHVAYNPHTGTYSRGAYVYGPAGSSSVGRAYNPYTGTRAASRRVDTVYGSAGRTAAYNPYTGTAARGGYRSDDRGTAAVVQTNRSTGAVGVHADGGGSAAAWDTRYGQGAAVKDKEGNVYAGKDGKVYQRDSSGNWNSRSRSEWQSSRPAPTRELNSQAGARSRGNQMSRGGGGRRR